MRDETLYETQYKYLVFDDCTIGNKYKIPDIATERGEVGWLCQLLCM